MEDTMSSYSFSHQFYQRWTCAPEPIRAAITQELKDITTLLQTETPFESFVFSTHDLDAHLDNLYENHDAEQAIAKAIADKQAQARATAEKERLEEQQKIQAAEEAKRKAEAKIEEETRLREEAEAEVAQQAPQKNEPLAADKNSSDKNNLDAKTAITHANDTSKVTAPSVDKVDNSADSNTAKAQPTEPSNAVKTDVNNDSSASSENKTVSEHANTISGNAISDSHIANDKRIKEDSSIKTINDKASAAIKLALKDAKLNTTHQELIRELEMQIDDYLSEQMMLMSENLKSWLRAEMTQNLSEDKVETNKES
ncbi:hypothetical protein [Psychrobacter sp. WB2]|jgi:hypothetical protein|uniref:hypothetical protein n=1 Tax=Psychrobacter maritimus TaxID=256325 RepID=UPI00248BBEDF|nr:hypothetical protein [Psychrobacter sp. WB2]WGV13121.1 hypothetical protein QJS82_00010 [Psychrobacter sp. WB2]